MIRGYTARLDPVAVGRDYQPLAWITLDLVTRESLTEFESAARHRLSRGRRDH